MKKALLLFVAAVTFLTTRTVAQTKEISPAERKITDSVCVALNKLDVSNVKTKKDAIAVYTECISRKVDLLQEWATEQGIDFADTEAMRAIGIKLAQNLMKENCTNFMKLATKMGGKDDEEGAVENITGTFKRIDNRGFNYIVLNDAAGREKSFLWLRQFPGSETFSGPTSKLIGKKIKVSSQEIEVYLPAAKGYYKVKEITGIKVIN